MNAIIKCDVKSVFYLSLLVYFLRHVFVAKEVLELLSPFAREKSDIVCGLECQFPYNYLFSMLSIKRVYNTN